MSCHRLSAAKMFLLPFCAAVLFQIHMLVPAFFTRLIFRTKPRLCKTAAAHKTFRLALFLLCASLVFLPAKAMCANDRTSHTRKQYLESQLRLLREDITQNPEVIEIVKRANTGNAQYTQEDVLKMDQQWRQAEGVDLFIVSLISNDLADKLKMFQKKQRDLVEIFVTDQRGLLIAATNKTSDFYQADEDWWKQAFQRNNPNGFLGEVEYDESALVEAVPLYLVMTDERRTVVGILKAVCGNNKILKEAAS